MRSKRVSNRVESRFDRRSRSPTKHTSVQLSSSTEIVATIDKSESPEAMSYSSGSFPSRHSETMEYVSHRTEYKSDSKHESADQLSSQTFMERKVETDVQRSNAGVTSQSITTESTVSHTQVLELPPENWPLKEAINRDLFDSESGLVAIPGTDRLVSSEETVRLKIIDPNSAVVVDPKAKRKVPLLRSFKKGILDSTGHYVKSGQKKIPMKEAIDSKLIQFEKAKTVRSKPTTTKVLRLTTTEGEPDKLDVIINPTLAERSLSDIPESTTLKSEETTSTTIREQSVEIEDGIYYSPKSNTVLFNKTGERIDLMTAIHSKRVDSKLFSVTDPDSGKSMTMEEALKRRVVDKKTGDLVSKKSDKKLIIPEIAKQGLLVLAASPLALTQTLESYMDTSPHESAISKTVVSDSDQVAVKDVHKHRPVRTASPLKEDKDMSTTKMIRETTQVMKSKELLLKVPKTGREVPLDEAVEIGLIDVQTAQKLKTSDAALEGFDVEKKRELTIQDPATGAPFPLKVAVKRGIIDSDTAKRLERGDIIENLVTSNVTVVESPKTIRKSIPSEKPADKQPLKKKDDSSKSPTGSLSKTPSSSVPSSPSQSPARSPTRSPTRGRSPSKLLEPLKKPRFEVGLGSAQTLPSPEKEVIIKKVPKRAITPKSAVEESLIDAETARIIESVPKSLPLEEVVVQNIIDGEKGSILEPQTGEKVSIRKALHLGLLDGDKKSFVYPIGRSLSLPSLIEKGLFNTKERRIVHPVTGQLLTLGQAIACDIVDKHSKLTEPKSKKPITLEEAISKGVVDSVTCDITTASERKMSLVDAVKTNYIRLPLSLAQRETISQKTSQIPELALSYRAALESGLINLDSLEFTHPITKEVMSMSGAIERGFIADMTKHNESTIIEDSVITKIVESKNINSFASQLVDTSQRGSLGESVPLNPSTTPYGEDDQKPTEKIKKPLYDGRTEKAIKGTTDDGNIVFALDSKTKSQVSASVVKTTVETLITSSGEVTMRTSSAVQPMAEAMKLGGYNLATGTFTSPPTGETISISEALRRNLLQSQKISTQTEIDSNKYTISSAFSSSNDKETVQFKEPHTGELMPFEKLVDKGFIDLNTVIYNKNDRTVKTTKDAIKEGEAVKEDPRWQDAAYALAHYKTEPCSKPSTPRRLCRQGYFCPQFHNNKDKRRSPNKFKYGSKACPNVKPGNEWGDPSNCEYQDSCLYCHTRTEQQYHPLIFKSASCKNMQQTGHCNRGPFCAFAHIETSDEIVAPRELTIDLSSSGGFYLVVSQTTPPLQHIDMLMQSGSEHISTKYSKQTNRPDDKELIARAGREIDEVSDLSTADFHGLSVTDVYELRQVLSRNALGMTLYEFQTMYRQMYGQNIEVEFVPHIFTSLEQMIYIFKKVFSLEWVFDDDPRFGDSDKFRGFILHDARYRPQSSFSRPRRPS